MICYILTPDQKAELHGQHYANCQIFNCTIDVNGDWYLCLSPGDEIIIASTHYAWVLNLPTGEFVPPEPPTLPNS